MAIRETMLQLRKRLFGNGFTKKYAGDEPPLRADWNGFTLRYRYRETVYSIAVTQLPGGDGKTRVTVDGVEQPDPAIPLVDDRREHAVAVSMAGGRGEGDAQNQDQGPRDAP